MLDMHGLPRTSHVLMMRLTTARGVLAGVPEMKASALSDNHANPAQAALMFAAIRVLLSRLDALSYPLGLTSAGKVEKSSVLSYAHL
jgi:hypothetical protein